MNNSEKDQVQNVIQKLQKEIWFLKKMIEQICELNNLKVNGDKLKIMELELEISRVKSESFPCAVFD